MVKSLILVLLLFFALTIKSFSFSDKENCKMCVETYLQEIATKMDLREHPFMLYFLNNERMFTCHTSINPAFILMNKGIYPELKVIEIVNDINISDENIYNLYRKIGNSDTIIFDFDNKIKKCFGFDGYLNYILFDKGFKQIGRAGDHSDEFSDIMGIHNNYNQLFTIYKLPMDIKSLYKPSQLLLNNDTLHIADKATWTFYSVDLKNNKISSQINFNSLVNKKLFQILETNDYDTTLVNMKKYFKRNMNLFYPIQYIGFTNINGTIYQVTQEIDDYEYIDKRFQFLDHTYISNTNNDFKKRVGFITNSNYFARLNNTINTYLSGTKHFYLINNDFEIIDSLSINDSTFVYSDNYAMISDNNNNIFIVSKNNNIFKFTYNGKALKKDEIKAEGKLSFLVNLFQNETLSSILYNKVVTLNLNLDNIYYYNDKLLVFLKENDGRGYLQVYNSNSGNLEKELKVNFFNPNFEIKKIYYISTDNEYSNFLVQYSDGYYYLVKSKLEI